MQRLIYSSRIPSKFRANPHSYVPGRSDPLKVGPSVPAPGSGCVRFGLVRRRLRLSCVVNGDDEPPPSSARFSPIIGSYGDRPPPESQPVEQKKEVGSISRKAFLAGKIVLLLALALVIIRPIFPSPAFASFPTAATKTGSLLRTEVLTSAWAGFLAGCLHTLSGPDHLAALAPLSIGRSRVESAAVGALWGCGHDAGQLIFGLVFLLLKDRLHIEVIRTWGSRVVGLTLLAIGAVGVREASEVSEAPRPCIPPEDGDVSIFDSPENPNFGKKKKIGFATFATGIVHGLQPDALMMVLPALALPSRVAGAAFLFMFLVGTVAAMGGYTVFIGSCSEALKDRVPRITEKLTWASSLVAIGLGLAIIVSQYFGYTLY